MHGQESSLAEDFSPPQKKLLCLLGELATAEREHGARDAKMREEKRQEERECLLKIQRGRADIIIGRTED